MMTIASFVGQISGGWLTDKIGRGISCKTGLVGLSSGAILLAWHYNSEILLAIVLILFSISWTVGHNGISTILTDYSERERPITASLNSAVRFVSGGIGFYLSGFIVKFSFSLGFLILGFMMLMLILWLNKVIIGYK
jgi:MFS family permease